jgi:hypothetical protein
LIHISILAVWSYPAWIIIFRRTIFISALPPVEYIPACIRTISWRYIFVPAIRSYPAGIIIVSGTIFISALSPVKYISSCCTSNIPVVSIVAVKLPWSNCPVIIALYLWPVNTHLVIPELASPWSVGFPEPYRPDTSCITFCVIATWSIDKNIIAITIVVDDRCVIDDRCIPAPVYIIIIDVP